jgi:hypothetical protein
VTQSLPKSTGGKGASELVAGLAPGARVVKVFNSIVTVRFNEGPIKNGGRRVIFVSGDHPEPTEFVKSVIESFDFVALYLGGLPTSGRLHQAGGPRARRDPSALDRLSSPARSRYLPKRGPNSSLRRSYPRGRSRENIVSRRRPAHDAALGADHIDRGALELSEVALGRVLGK